MTNTTTPTRKSDRFLRIRLKDLELNRQLNILAAEREVSKESLVEQAIREFLKKEGR